MPQAKLYTPEEIRNVALIGHGHCGKTSLAEAIFYDDGVTTRLGKTADKTSTFDSEPEEIHRGGSIVSHFGWVDHGGKKINLIDTPGDQNFFLDGLTAMMGADGAVIVVSAVSGAGLQTKKAAAWGSERNLSQLVFINKMDRAAAPWKDLVERVSSALHLPVVPVEVPIGSGDTFKGVIDLFTRSALTWNRDGSGKLKVEPSPAEMASEIEEAQAAMIESIVSTDDALLEKYLESGDIMEAALKTAFLRGVRDRKIVPLYFGSASFNMGVQPVLDAVATLFPNPIERGPLSCTNESGEVEDCHHDPQHPFLAQVIHTIMDEHTGQISVLRLLSGEFPKDGQAVNADTGEEIRLGPPYLLRGKERMKVDSIPCGDIVSVMKVKNTHTNNTLCAPGYVRKLPKMSYPKPMISYIVIPETKNDDDKLKVAIDRLIEEDPTLAYSVDDLSHRMVLHGMGHGHLESSIERMKRKYQVHVKTDLPPVPYRETFAKPVTNIEGKHKKQTGGAGQYGVCYIDVIPLERDKGFEFVNEVYGGAVPRQFIPSVEKGVVERAKHGLLAGYPLVDFRVALKDGKHHPVDSKDIAFQQAGSKALKAAMQTAGLKLLEPHYKMDIIAPSANAGDIMGDITSRRGHVNGMETLDDSVVVHASCPLSEVQRYLPDLRSMTGGKGSFVMEFDCYRDVPSHLVDKIAQTSPFKREEKDETND